jgi:hypothetical protein
LPDLVVADGDSLYWSAASFRGVPCPAPFAFQEGREIDTRTAFPSLCTPPRSTMTIVPEPSSTITLLALAAALAPRRRVPLAGCWQCLRQGTTGGQGGRGTR